MKIDSRGAQVLVRRYVGRSQLCAYWWPPRSRYTRFELWVGDEGAVMLSIGRLEFGRYRKADDC